MNNLKFTPKEPLFTKESPFTQEELFEFEKWCEIELANGRNIFIDTIHETEWGLVKKEKDYFLNLLKNSTILKVENGKITYKNKIENNQTEIIKNKKEIFDNSNISYEELLEIIEQYNNKIKEKAFSKEAICEYLNNYLNLGLLSPQDEPFVPDNIEEILVLDNFILLMLSKTSYNHSNYVILTNDCSIEEIEKALLDFPPHVASLEYKNQLLIGDEKGTLKESCSKKFIKYKEETKYFTHNYSKKQVDIYYN